MAKKKTQDAEEGLSFAHEKAPEKLGAWAVVSATGRYLDRTACWNSDVSRAWLFHSKDDAEAYNALHCGAEHGVALV